MKRNLLFMVAFLMAATLLAIPRAEYPRPQFERQDWVNLNGDWTYTFDFVGSGMEKHLHQSQGFADKITVPFCPESKLSGVGYTDFINHIWYQRSITMPQAWSGRRVRLNFGAVYYNSEIFIDGKLAGRHFGGSTSFGVDITRFVADGKAHSLVVHAYSDTRTNLQPAGKQNVRMTQFECMYTRCTGIWQTVWMEPVDACGLERAQVLTDIDQSQVIVHPTFCSEGAATLTVTMSDGKKVVATKTVPAQNNSTIVLPVKKARLWSPADPFLYTLSYEVKDEAGKCIDQVSSYVGMRKIHVKGNKVYLNNEPFYQRLVLDQGFYPDGIWTAPSDEALKQDIAMSKAVGFNGARLHQKVFEERYYYWADRLGYLTWGEEASWGLNVNNNEAVRNFLTEWADIVVRDRNHPSLVTWTPLNETWDARAGVYVRFVNDLYNLTKAIDPTRPVNDASGDSHVKTDIWTVHDYTREPEKLIANHTIKAGVEPYRNMKDKDYLANFAGQPYMVDEFGGLPWIPKEERANSWGYGQNIETLEDFYTILEKEIDALKACKYVVGFCYTQITDVEQEKNGIYYYDRRPKFDTARLKAIFEKIPSVIENPQDLSDWK